MFPEDPTAHPPTLAVKDFKNEQTASRSGLAKKKQKNEIFNPSLSASFPLIRRGIVAKSLCSSNPSPRSNSRLHSPGRSKTPELDGVMLPPVETQKELGT